MDGALFLPGCREFGRFPSPFPLPIPGPGLEAPAMTRPAIQNCIKIFLVALIITFIWTVTRVLEMLGWW
jgi:hypothetical protein